ncbi:hypothetical protein SDRG_11721 [Saprolegnia diclina VS20]|uniref:Glycosyl transferase family 1 domain-containing protein n=1 Tax=Saprolegnia diclina (strain VS20) TaxID=1156394 RepID=T0RL54_SAPDV|nr:hypothetical protein SDRG_11721 [Saprolegnia diclina VS20]EQC30667.1 hypothetical protein SDRG_11721 [Saprolegnia diclina VS20]|eukprot:XP_008615993.1 hypothetical protein SDRG_11721 [Saprolegnia diclina VS20]
MGTGRKHQPASRTPIVYSACILLVFLLNLYYFGYAGSASPRLKQQAGDAPSVALAATTTASQCWFDGPIGQRVPTEDLEHLSLLHSACMEESDDIITWYYGSPVKGPYPTRLKRDDPRVLDELRRCPDIDIFLPNGLRGAGYCEDGGAYTKYGHSRLLPQWVLDDEYFDAQRNRKVTYHDLCPRTPIIFFNHYWPSQPWPKHKPMYLMPNIEMGQLKAPDYWSADVIICKSRDCHHRVTKWLEQEGNPRGTAVFYTRHTTADIAGHTSRKLGPGGVKPKDYSKNIRFTHTAGGSVSKGTDQVIECWLSRPDLPPLDLFMSPGLYNLGFGDKFGAQIAAASNMNFHHTGLDEVSFGKLMAEAGFFLCASTWEGYGHYINQARAAGGVIITTNGPPMNELIVPPVSGVYVETTARFHPHQILGGEFDGEHGLRDVTGLKADHTKEALCDAVDYVLSLPEADRKALARGAEQAYHDDTKFFAAAMRDLRAFARAHLHSSMTAAEVASSKTWRNIAADQFPCVSNDN